MGVSVHRTCRVKRVEGRRDETHTVKTNWSPRGAAKTKEKPAGINWRNRDLYRRCERGTEARPIALRLWRAARHTTPAEGVPSLATPVRWSMLTEWNQSWQQCGHLGMARRQQFRTIDLKSADLSPRR
jgi:hypothetical protein